MEKDQQREKDIQELCNQVLKTLLLPERGDCGYSECPFCYAQGNWNDHDVSEIEHDINCAYLIAKDLSTNN